VDKCVECGYCERRCPSREFTLTPRQRIGVRRALVKLQSDGETELYRDILADFQHDGLDTCAVDGLCATDCPVNINTGDLIKRLRRESHSPKANADALKVAKNFKAIEGVTKLSMKTGFALNHLLGPNTMPRISRAMGTFHGIFPEWRGYITKPSAIHPHQPKDPQFVYFASCVSRMMGADKQGSDIMQVFLSVAKKANVRVIVPNDIRGACCGQIFSSKGFDDAYAYTANQTIEKLWRWSHLATLPIVMDLTSCTHTLQQCRPALTDQNKIRFDQLQFMDSIDFAADILLPKLSIAKKKSRIVFHPVCSTYKMNLMGKLKAIGNACAETVEIPYNAGCCGMAGDRGFYYPQLIQAATKAETTEVNAQNYDGYYSSAKTCEMSMSEATGKNYLSILYLLDEATE